MKSQRKCDGVFIGRLRRDLFVPFDSEWNGMVRDITAKLENHDAYVDEATCYREIVMFLRDKECGKAFASAFAGGQV